MLDLCKLQLPAG